MRERRDRNATDEWRRGSLSRGLFSSSFSFPSPLSSTSQWSSAKVQFPPFSLVFLFLVLYFILPAPLFLRLRIDPQKYQQQQHGDSSKKQQDSSSSSSSSSSPQPSPSSVTATGPGWALQLLLLQKQGKTSHGSWRTLRKFLSRHSLSTTWLVFET